MRAWSKNLSKMRWKRNRRKYQLKSKKQRTADHQLTVDNGLHTWNKEKYRKRTFWRENLSQRTNIVSNEGHIDFRRMQEWEEKKGRKEVKKEVKTRLGINLRLQLTIAVNLPVFKKMVLWNLIVTSCEKNLWQKRNTRLTNFRDSHEGLWILV